MLNVIAVDLSAGYGVGETMLPRLSKIHMSILRAEGLVKSYKRRTVVNGISFEIHPGEIVGLLGPNGAGKTTSFYMVVGLVKPVRADVSCSTTVTSASCRCQTRSSGISYLAQEPSAFRKLTAAENIMLVLEMQPRLTSQERKERMEGLSRALDSPSGGTRRRRCFPAANGGAWRSRVW